MNKELLEVISKEFCGDGDSLYEYKRGDDLVNFFKIYYNLNNPNRYFPTRWVYTMNCLEILYYNNLLNDFFSLITSLDYIKREKNIKRVEAVSFTTKLINNWNRKLRRFNYYLIKTNSGYNLKSIDDDLDLIGEGGFSKVYLQKSTGLILKKLKDENLVDKSYMHRFKREYNITKSLHDIPGIIEVFDFNSDEYFYTMEKCDYTLEYFLNSSDLSLQQKENLVIRILNIISQVHKREVIHRDISPTNIFIKNNRIKIADFGLGKSKNLFNTYQTKHTLGLGQINYCAPEQLNDLKNTGKFSDVYSLGKLINYIFTGDSENKNHQYKILVEKAISENSRNRYDDAVSMHKAFLKIKRVRESSKNNKIIGKRIKKGIYDNKIKVYISSLTSEDLCKNIIHIDNFTKVLCMYLEENEERTLEILEYIYESFAKTAKYYEDADNFAYISYFILKENLATFEAREKAAGLLKYIAFGVNRYYAQDLIKDLINLGIEPLLLDILKPKTI